MGSDASTADMNHLKNGYLPEEVKFDTAIEKDSKNIDDLFIPSSKPPAAAAPAGIGFLKRNTDLVTSSKGAINNGGDHVPSSHIAVQ